jgi:hypothetical protein
MESFGDILSAKDVENIHAYLIGAEMSHDACRGLFALMHANNKIEYPHTPFIKYEFGSENVGSGHSLREIYKRIKERHNSADASTSISGARNSSISG